MDIKIVSLHENEVSYWWVDQLKELKQIALFGPPSIWPHTQQGTGVYVFVAQRSTYIAPSLSDCLPTVKPMLMRMPTPATVWWPCWRRFTKTVMTRWREPSTKPGQSPKRRRYEEKACWTFRCRCFSTAWPNESREGREQARLRS